MNITTMSVQITIKDGWAINRVWIYTLDENGEILSVTKSQVWQARRHDGDANRSILDRAAAMHRVGELEGYTWLAESIDFSYHPETGETAAALIHFYKE